METTKTEIKDKKETKKDEHIGRKLLGVIIILISIGMLWVFSWWVVLITFLIGIYCIFHKEGSKWV